jgi:VIT1/CCC1 family predicted Fe2+/Mn2+ transporter
VDSVGGVLGLAGTPLAEEGLADLSLGWNHGLLDAVGGHVEMELEVEGAPELVDLVQGVLKLTYLVD